MDDPTLPLPGLSSVSGKTVIAKFDDGQLSSDGGILMLREVSSPPRPVGQSWTSTLLTLTNSWMPKSEHSRP